MEHQDHEPGHDWRKLNEALLAPDDCRECSGMGRVPMVDYKARVEIGVTRFGVCPACLGARKLSGYPTEDFGKYIRPSLLRFAVAMENRMRAKDELKSNQWRSHTTESMLGRLSDHVHQLWHAVRYRANVRITREEAADVANYCMMLCEAHEYRNGHLRTCPHCKRAQDDIPAEHGVCLGCGKNVYEPPTDNLTEM